MIALALCEVSALCVFFWFFMHRTWAYALPALAVFGIFRWVFDREAARMRRKYDD